MEYITILEYIGIVAFAASGAMIAMREEYDLFGIFILAFVTAVGGGIVRDITTNEGVPVFFSNPIWMLYIFIGIALAIWLRDQLENRFLFMVIDALGLASFVISSSLVAIDKEYGFLLYLYCAIMPGIGGGILRDVLASRKPMALRKDIYAVAGMIGAIILWFLYPFCQKRLAAFLCLAIIFIIRVVTYQRGINLPVIYPHDGHNHIENEKIQKNHVVS